ncbi:SDR family NAD(P)-dependent oxidoreductase [Cytophagales bacterium LB-30]|uniref:SDR family NAD(P)-dependent oxidoreductase n=1 Tax=Shiella aurantiaca TaxID=3058365 RepID=A0ABT8F710_9BACT|nr:SDR family NAD(P)-dependent oxidoreductase [Shiella aurantiaca]MDN4166273.1 SDR family NAD(P)-dependent oxidoreductase [Shiella aurantiaca]
METWIITGASRGIGLSLAQQAVAEGYQVFGLARSVPDWSHPNFQFVSVDLSTDAGLQKAEDMVRNTVQKAAQVVLVNNAALLAPVGPLGSWSRVDITKALQVNVGAVATLMNAFHQASTQAESAMVLNISSGAGKRPIAGWAMYCSAKAAMDMLSLTYAEEQALVGSNRQVYSISPGVVDTDMQAEIRASSVEVFPRVAYFKELKSEGRLASPEAVAKQIIQFAKAQKQQGEVLQDVRQW